MSLSARRAWIEISIIVMMNTRNGVALRKESVDRNSQFLRHGITSIMSLSARRAWIEIAVQELLVLLATGRSPQGERG